MFEIALPNYILVIVETIHDPNDIRRSLNGERGFNFPQTIEENVRKQAGKEIKDELLIPIHFAILRNPIKIRVGGDEKTLRKGIGAMQLYKYIGKPDELDIVLKEMLKLLSKKKQEGKSWFKNLTNFQIIIGKDSKVVIEEDLDNE